MGPLDFTVVSPLLSSMAALKSTWKTKCYHLLDAPDTTKFIYHILSVVLPLFLPSLPNFIRTPQDCRPKIKVGLNYITKCYLLSMD